MKINQLPDNFFSGMSQHNFYSLPRFYCGPYAGNFLVPHVAQMLNMSDDWVKPMIEQVTSLTAPYDVVRDLVCCSGGPGNRKAFLMHNFLDRCTVRAHVALTDGVFHGPREIKYERGDVIIFDQPDFGKRWTHEYKNHCFHVVLCLGRHEEIHISNWKLFADHCAREK